jgi:hypothetical protein
MATVAKTKSAMQLLMDGFAESALRRSEKMSDKDFRRIVKESHEIIDRRRKPPSRKRGSA